MNDVLVFRDSIWFLRYVGWLVLYFYYINRLEPRSVHKSVSVICFTVSLAITAGLQYGATITLLFDTIIKVLCWFFICLILRKTDWRNALYGSLAFAVIDDLSKIISHDLIYIYFLEGLLENAPQMAANLAFTALYLLICFLITFGFRTMIFKSDKRLFSPLQMGLILLPTIVYFYARNFQFILRNATDLSVTANSMLHVYILLLLLGLSVLLISILADNNLSTRLQQEELQHMQALIQKQHQDFVAQKSATEAIQQKYHDLKNCLIGLKGEGDTSSPEKQKLIEEVEQIMRPIETNVETGNHFLNIILAEKIAVCQKYQIRLTPYADGRELSFIDGLDLCVIVGNALDNAIEAVQKLPPEKREIHMKVSSSGNMMIFFFQNYYSGTLLKNEMGFFKSQKKDASHHGYGLKGISKIVDLYHGSMAVDHTEHEFTLNILIPIPAKDQLSR